jgi:hypothetical protein
MIEQNQEKELAPDGWCFPAAIFAEDMRKAL